MPRPPKIPNKQTYYHSRGKVHLIHPQSIVDEAKTYCGLGLESTNHNTTEVKDCTCQRCLMHMTKTWGGKDRGRHK